MPPGIGYNRSQFNQQGEASPNPQGGGSLLGNLPSSPVAGSNFNRGGDTEGPADLQAQNVNRFRGGAGRMNPQQMQQMIQMLRQRRGQGGGLNRAPGFVQGQLPQFQQQGQFNPAFANPLQVQQAGLLSGLPQQQFTGAIGPQQVPLQQGNLPTSSLLQQGQGNPFITLR